MREVGAAVAAALGRPVTGVAALEPGASSGRTFAVTLAGGDAVVAKVALPDRPSAPAVRTLGVLRGLGVPGPEVLAVGRLGDGRDVVVMTRLPGQDLHRALPAMTRDQLTALAVRITAIQDAVGRLPITGRCGYVAVGEPGTRTWDDVVRRPNGFRYADPPPADAADLLARLTALVDRAAGRLAAIPPGCFLDDLTTRNVLVEDGRLSGVVDLDVVCQGDRRLHLGLTAAAVLLADVPLGDHYVAELLRAAGSDEDDRRHVDLYAAVYLVNFLGAEHAHRPGPWRRRAAAEARRRLDSAEAWFR